MVSPCFILGTLCSFADNITATIIAFSVKTPRGVENAAARDDIPIYKSDIIYRVMEEVKERLIPLLPVVVTTKIRGEANVQAVFDINVRARKFVKVAGCKVFSGLAEKSKVARVVRDDKTLFEGICFHLLNRRFLTKISTT